MKQNDWIVENLEYGLTPSEFKSIGLSTENTQLLPMDTYLKSSYITDNPLFKNNDGTFSKDKFKDFYNKAALGFLKFSQDLDTFQYDLFDTSRKVGSEVKNPQMLLYQVSNPSRLKIGIAARNEVSEGDLTNKELALQNKIYDPSTGKYLDESVNDLSLFKNPVKWFENILSDPIVYATYDDDGTHIDPITGQEVLHKKGDFKMNKDGEYYTEKLAGRNIRGKEIVSAFDYITSEDQAINKYDFFDADGLDKSITGSLFSAAATVAPLFVPYVGEVYSAALIGREISKALPMLSGMLDALLGTDMQNNSVLNSIAAKGSQFTGGTSVYGEQNALSVEGVSKLLADVATQWSQLKLIAQGISKLTGAEQIMKEATTKAVDAYATRAIYYEKVMGYSEDLLLKLIGVRSTNELDTMIKSGKWAETAIGKAAKDAFIPQAEKAIKGLNRIGADASLGYMAIVSNTDVYEDLIEHGASKGEAALFALGSTLGMFGVDRTGIGELFFDELADNTGKFIPKNLNELMKPWRNSMQGEKVVSKNIAKRLIDKGKKFGDNYINGYLSDIKHHTTSFLGKAIGEGAEEFSEELVTDLTKQLYETLGQFGVTSQTDVGAWDNFWQRGLQSFFGGALGGGVFYGVGLVNGQYPLQQGPQDMLFHIRNGKADAYYKKIDEWEKQGKFGSTELSATPTEVSDGKGGTTQVYLNTTDSNQTLNHFIAERVRDAVREAEAIIVGNKLDLTDDELFENLVQKEQRFLDLKDWLKDKSYATSYYEDYLGLVSKIVDAEIQLLKASDTQEGLADGTPLVNKDQWLRDNEKTDAGRLREENLNKLREKRDLLMKQKEDFLSGENAYYYARKMIFALDPVLSSSFFPTNFEQWLKQEGVEDPEKLSVSDLENRREEYDNWIKTNMKSNLTDTFTKFLEIEKRVIPIIQTLEGDDDEYLKVEQELKSFFEELGEDLLNEFNRMWQNMANPNMEEFNEQLEYETPEEFAAYKQAVAKTDKDANDLQIIDARKVKVQRQIKTNLLRKILNALSSGKIDPASYRRIIQYTLSPFEFTITQLKDLLIEQTLGKKILSYDNPTAVFKPETIELYHNIKVRLAAGIDLEDDEKNFITTYETNVDLYNKDISRLTELLPDLLLSTIINLIKDNLKYNIDGSNNASDIMTQILGNATVKGLIEEYNERTLSASKLKFKNYANWLTILVKNIVETEMQETAKLAEDAGYFGLYNPEYPHVKKNNLGPGAEYVSALFDSSLFTKLQKALHLYTPEFTPDYILDSGDDLTNTYLENGIEGIYIDTSKFTVLDFLDILNALEPYNKDVDTIRELKEILEAAPDKTKLIDDFSKEVVLDLLAIVSKDDVNNLLRHFNEEIDKNLDILFAKDLGKLILIENPFTTFLNAFANKLGVEDIEEELNLIAKSIEKEGVENIRLTTQQMAKFKAIQDVINVALGYLYAASNLPSFLTPYGHNHTINEYMKNAEKLPEITESTALIFAQECKRYMQEIDNLISISNLNYVNKSKRFAESKIKSVNVKLKLFEVIGPIHFTTDSGDKIDLLEGPVDETASKLVQLLLKEEILHKNIQNLISQGYSLRTILERTKLLDNIITDDFTRQETSKMDENFKYEDFTSYDKFMYLMNIISLDSREWSKHMVKEIEANLKKKIVPLTIQQEVARTAAAFLNDSSIFKEGVQYLLDKKLINMNNLKIMDNLIFLSGIGGAGKTQVGTKYALDFIIEKYKLEDDQILITGSTEKVRDNIRLVLGKGKIIDKPEDVPGGLEIIKQALDPAIYAEIMKEVDEANSKSSYTEGTYIKVARTNGGKSITLKWDILKDKLNDDAPEIIVIDEATHLSSVELEILNKWAKRGVVAIGDPSLSGFLKVGGNINYEENFTFRTQKLGISLRDNNLQNLLNQTKLAELIEEISALDAADPNYEQKAKNIIESKIEPLTLRAYNGQVLNGTLYTASITDDIIDKMQGDNVTIAFLGSKTSGTLTSIKSKNFKSVLQYDNVALIQGLEFDYVIVDKDFLANTLSYIKDPNSVKNNLKYYWLALRDLYTVISRARIGSVIKLSEHMLGETIVDKFQATAPSITDEKTLKAFSEAESKDFNSFLSIPEFKSTISVTKTTSSTGSATTGGAAGSTPTSTTGAGSEGSGTSGEETSGSGEEGSSGSSEGGVESSTGGEESSRGSESGGEETSGEDSGEEDGGDDIDPYEEVLEEDTSEVSEPTVITTTEIIKPERSVTSITEPTEEKEFKTANAESFPIYTSFNLIGSLIEFFTYGTDSEGKPKNYQKWICKTSPSYKVRRDIDIFLYKSTYDNKTLTGEIINPDSTEEEKKQKFELYLQTRSNYEFSLNILKTAIIRNKSWEEVSSFLGSYITKEQFENLKQNTYITVEEPEEDWILGTNIGVKGKIEPSLTDSDGRPKVVKLIAETTDEDGNTIVLTLGLGLNVSSQEVKKNHIEKFTNRTKAEIERLQRLIDQEKSKDRPDPNVIAFYELLIILYQNRIDSIKEDTNNYEEALKNISTNGGKYRVNLEENPISRLQPISSDADEPRTIENLRKNRQIFISKPYIYFGGVPGIDDSVKGLVVVFAEPDPLAQESNIMERYIAQKTSGNTGKIRMLVLSSRGVHFLDLCYINESRLFGRLMDENKLPIAWPELGIKFFGIAWNFRANLKQYLEEYQKFLEEHKDDFTEEELEQVAGIQRITSRNSEKAKKIKEAIDAFNKRLNDLGIRLFRLGGMKSGKSGKNVTHRIGKAPIKLNGEILKDYNAIYLPPSKAKNFDSLMDGYFKVIFEHLNNVDSSLINNPAELLTGKDNNTKNIRSNIKKTDRQFEYNDKALGTTKDMTTIALITIKLFTRLANETTDPDYDNSFTLFRKYNDDGSVDDSNAITVNFDELAKNDAYSRDTYHDLFLLLMHGTTNHKLDKNKRTDYGQTFSTVDKCDEAYFKLGIFLNTIGKKADKNAPFTECTVGEWAFTLDATVTPPVVFCTPYKAPIEEEETKSVLLQDMEDKNVLSPVDYIFRLLRPLIPENLIVKALNSLGGSFDTTKTLYELVEQIQNKIYQELLNRSFDSNTPLEEGYYKEGNKLILFTEYIEQEYKSSVKESYLKSTKLNGTYKVLLEDDSIVTIECTEDINGKKDIRIKRDENKPNVDEDVELSKNVKDKLAAIAKSKDAEAIKAVDELIQAHTDKGTNEINIANLAGELIMNMDNVSLEIFNIIKEIFELEAEDDKFDIAGKLNDLSGKFTYC